MSNDERLIEFAAKAAGFSQVRFYPQIHHGMVEVWDGQKTICWTPLLDDGDAFRLAVKLKIEVQFFDGFGEIAAQDNLGEVAQCCEHYCDDMSAAVRRSIVRAAAAIGESMP